MSLVFLIRGRPGLAVEIVPVLEEVVAAFMQALYKSRNGIAELEIKTVSLHIGPTEAGPTLHPMTGNGARGGTYTLAEIVSRVTIPVLADPAGFPEQHEHAGINEEEMLRLASGHERLQFAQHKLAVLAEEPRVVDAVELRQDHARDRDSAKQGISVIPRFGLHSQQFFSKEPRGSG